MDALELELRQLLWWNHGHDQLYGDDGEMQCGQCLKYGCGDYKRAPLAKLREGYNLARANRVPVAWRVKDFADGWILCNTLKQAQKEAEGAGNLIEPLYLGCTMF